MASHDGNGVSRRPPSFRITLSNRKKLLLYELFSSKQRNLCSASHYFLGRKIFALRVITLKAWKPFVYELLLLKQGNLRSTSYFSSRGKNLLLYQLLLSRSEEYPAVRIVILQVGRSVCFTSYSTSGGENLLPHELLFFKWEESPALPIVTCTFAPTQKIVIPTYAHAERFACEPAPLCAEPIPP